MQNNKKIKIQKNQSRQRLDKFLAGFCPEKSRSGWQKSVRNREVLINNEEKKPDYILKEDDEIEILEISPAPFFKGGSFQEKGEKIEIPQIKIIYEDDNVIVIDKPAGALSHGASSSKNPNVVDFLLDHFPKIKDVGEDGSRPGIVHRLDKDTSGVMIVAKNNKSFQFLKDQFKNRKVQKTYLALVYGNIEPKEGAIYFRIGRSKTKQGAQTAIDTKKKMDIKSREAMTQYKTIKTFDGYSLLEVFPKTGRMHQIRVHLKAIGYPIVGDRMYTFKKYRKDKIVPDRQFLHASELKITLSSGKKCVFKSDLSQDLKKFLEKLIPK